MEIQKRLSECWQSCLACFEKPNKTDGQEKRRKIDPATIIVNPQMRELPSPTPIRLPSRPSARSDVFYIARYNYTARTEEDLSFSAGDTLEALDKSRRDWWFAKALTGVSSSKKGYIPANFVAPLESIDAEPWYFPETKRLDAEKLLLAEGNKSGAFLIRESESHKGELSLSVLDGGTVSHYKVQRLENGHYYMSVTQTFLTLKELVEYYSKQADGLCVRLGKPCIRALAPQTNGLSYNTVDKWEIDRKSIKLLYKLGAGHFGEVFLGAWNCFTHVAVKTLKPGTMDPKEFLREAQIMKSLRHPKLIQLYAVCTTEEPIYIITELMDWCLLEYLQMDKGAKLKLSDQIDMAAQVASGMAYLELQNYIHRDLAARNVLVGYNNICKVADFGLARVFMRENENIYEAKEGTKFPVRWTAPEVIQENRFSIKSDIWSFGILLHEIMTFGQMPYPTFTNMQVIQRITLGYQMPCPPGCPKTIYGIMMDCWRENEFDRPTFETLQWKLEDYFDIDASEYDDTVRN